MLYKDFDPCDVYDVPIYLSSFGLSVDKRFRGRNIGTQLLDSRFALAFFNFLNSNIFHSMNNASHELQKGTLS